MFRRFLSEVRSALTEDPDSFFAAGGSPKQGRRTANTSMLMGFEEPQSPEEDDTSEIPNSNTPSPDFVQTLRDPRYRRAKEADAGRTVKQIVGPGDVSR